MKQKMWSRSRMALRGPALRSACAAHASTTATGLLQLAEGGCAGSRGHGNQFGRRIWRNASVNTFCSSSGAKDSEMQTHTDASAALPASAEVKVDYGRVFSLYAMGKAIAQVTGTLDVQSKAKENESIVAARDSLLYKAIWKDNAEPGSAGKLAFYKVSDADGIKRIAVREVDAVKWTKRLGLDFDTLLPHLGLEAQHGWVAVDKAEFTPKELRVLLREHDNLRTNKIVFERTVSWLNGPSCDIARFVAIDVQASDSSPKKLTEVGISVFDRRSDALTTYHFVVSEHETLSNRFLPRGQRYETAFARPAEKWPTSAIFEFLQLKLSTVTAREHANANKWVGTPTSTVLETDSKSYRTAIIVSNQTETFKLLMNASLDKKGARIGEELLNSVPAYDVQRMLCGRFELNPSIQPKLRTYCTALGIPTDNVPQNAGTRAYWISAVFQSLLKGRTYAQSSLATVNSSGADRQNSWRGVLGSEKVADTDFEIVANKNKMTVAENKYLETAEQPSKKQLVNNVGKVRPAVPTSDPTAITESRQDDPNPLVIDGIRYFKKQDKLSSKVFRKDS
jgi:hypothetical protein